MAVCVGGRSLSPRGAVGTCRRCRQTTASAWLTEREKQLVHADLEADYRQAAPREHGFGQALKLARLWLLGAIYFCLTSANLTIPFWLPTIIQGLGVKNT